jgi:hypothetical protein
MIDATIVPRTRWLHGEALCPSCGLPIGRRDVDEELREVNSAQPVGASHALAVRGALSDRVRHIRS